MLRKNSDHVQTELPDYLFGKSTPTIAARIEQHLRECLECQEMYEGQRVLFERLTITKEETVSPSIWGPFLVKLNERIDSRKRLYSSLSDRFAFRIPAIAAVSLAVFGLLYFSTLVEQPRLNGYSQELRNLFSQFDTTEIVSLRNQFLWSNAFSVTTELELQPEKDLEEIDEAFPQTVFEGLTYDQLLVGSSEYLSQQDLIDLYSEDRLLESLMNGNSSL